MPEQTDTQKKQELSGTSQFLLAVGTIGGILAVAWFASKQTPKRGYSMGMTRDPMFRKGAISLEERLGPAKRRVTVKGASRRKTG